jgi:hypothetical protein
MHRLLAPIVLSLIIGCDGYTAAGGHIVDGNGTPLAEATITMTQSGDDVGIPESSGADGSFHASGSHAPSHDPLMFRVKKDGFRDHTQHIPAGIVDEDMRIVMERITNSDE